MSNLAQLFQVAPITAAGFTGQQFASDQAQAGLTQQKTLADIAKMQQEFAFNEQNNPLRLENQRLAIRGLEADLPGKVADSEGKVLDARKKASTFDSDVAATNSDNDLKVMGNQITKYNKISEVFSQAAHEVKDLPPIMRGVRLREILEQNRLKSDSPEAAGFLMEATQNPLALLARADEAKRRAIELSPSYYQAMAQARLQGENQVKVAEINERSHKYVADQNKAAKVEAAEKRAKGASDLMDGVRSGKVAPDKAAVQFEFLAMTEEDDKKKAFYTDMAAKANALAVQLREAGRLAGQPDPNALGIQTHQTPTPVMGQNGNGNSGKPDIAGQAKAAWGSYDPQKYEYRVGPNGNLQRKEK